MVESLRRILFYVQAFEKHFVREQLEKSSKEQKKELAKKRRELSKSEKRIAELDVLFQRIYEDNVTLASWVMSDFQSCRQAMKLNRKH